MAKKPKRKPRKVRMHEPPPTPIDPSSGLPKVGERSLSPAEQIARARAKHHHRPLRS